MSHSHYGYKTTFVCISYNFRSVTLFSNFILQVDCRVPYLYTFVILIFLLLLYYPYFNILATFYHYLVIFVLYVCMHACIIYIYISIYNCIHPYMIYIHRNLWINVHLLKHIYTHIHTRSILKKYIIYEIDQKFIYIYVWFVFSIWKSFEISLSMSLCDNQIKM